MQQPHSSAASPPPNSYVHPGSGNGPPSLGPTPGSDLGGGHLVGMDGHPSKRQRPDEPGLSGPPTQRQNTNFLWRLAAAVVVVETRLYL
ncbi:hypothetical protein BASA81_010710 [Batrachochytrium salamandrivorans]|nr:hypothetical protein BASA81_010710 [Batrachochytrium salamandrivorans]